MPLARKGSFAISPEPSREELEKLPFIGFSVGAAQPTTDELFSAMGISPRKILTVDSDLLALGYVKAGIGVASLREKHYRHEHGTLDGYPMDTAMSPNRYDFKINPLGDMAIAFRIGYGVHMAHMHRGTPPSNHTPRKKRWILRNW